MTQVSQSWLPSRVVVWIQVCAVGRSDVLRVPVGAEVGNGDDAVASLRHLPPTVSTTGSLSASRSATCGISWVSGSSPTYVVHSGLP